MWRHAQRRRGSNAGWRAAPLYQCHRGMPGSRSRVLVSSKLCFVRVGRESASSVCAHRVCAVAAAMETARTVRSRRKVPAHTVRAACVCTRTPLPHIGTKRVLLTLIATPAQRFFCTYVSRCVGRVFPHTLPNRLSDLSLGPRRNTRPRVCAAIIWTAHSPPSSAAAALAPHQLCVHRLHARRARSTSRARGPSSNETASAAPSIDRARAPLLPRLVLDDHLCPRFVQDAVAARAAANRIPVLQSVLVAAVAADVARAGERLRACPSRRREFSAHRDGLPARDSRCGGALHRKFTQIPEVPKNYLLFIS